MAELADQIALLEAHLEKRSPRLVQHLDELWQAGVPEEAEQIVLWTPLDSRDVFMLLTYTDFDGGTVGQRTDLLASEDEDVRRILREVDEGVAGVEVRRAPALANWFRRALARSHMCQTSLRWILAVNNVCSYYSLETLNRLHDDQVFPPEGERVDVRLEELQRALPALSDSQFAAFAILSVERYAPLYERSLERIGHETLRPSIVDALWRSALGGHVDHGDVALKQRAEPAAAELSGDEGCARAAVTMLSGALCRLGSADAGAERNFAAIASSLPDEYGFVDEHQEGELAYLVKVARALVPHAAVSREQVVALASEPTWLSELDED